jgi:hypothetical protein
MKLKAPFEFGDIYTVAQKAIDFARENVKRDGKVVKVEFEFNGLMVNAYSSSYVEDIVEKYFCGKSMFQ